MPYSSSLSDQEWEIIEPLLPKKKKLNRQLGLLKKIYPEIMTKIQFELSPKPSKSEKEKQGKSGFVPVKVRWVIERSNSWMERCKNLVKNFERTLEHANTKIHLCFVRLMLTHISDRLRPKKDPKWVLYCGTHHL